MEKQLYGEYKQLRKKGLKVKGWWFRVRGRQILSELNTEASFQFSNMWFDGFKERHHISLRRGTNVCQNPPEDKEAAIQHFHRSIRIKPSLGIDPGNTEPRGQWKKLPMLIKHLCPSLSQTAALILKRGRKQCG